MDKNEYISYLIRAFSDNGMAGLVDEAKAEKLYMLSNLLVETNKITNLTAITDEKGIILKHFLDCATVCSFLDVGARVLDVGCGAGFPSLPVAILRDDITVTSIDSTGKKINFVNHAADKLSLKNISALCCRAEDYVKEERERFDVCTSRAVARLNILSELCLPFVKVGGVFVAMKSDRGAEEYLESKKGIETLGGDLLKKELVTLNLENEQISRELYIIKKVRTTPGIYPRNYSQITKKPL